MGEANERIEEAIESLEEAQQAARRGLDDDQFSNRDENPLGGINHALAQLKTMKSALSATDTAEQSHSLAFRPDTNESAVLDYSSPADGQH